MANNIVIYQIYQILKDTGILSEIVSVSNEQFYVFTPTTGIWMQCTQEFAAGHICEAILFNHMGLREALSPPEAAYLASFNGSLRVVKSITNLIKDDHFEENLNKIPDSCIAFDNGLYSVVSDTLIPF
jgi:hypothetical protein